MHYCVIPFLSRGQNICHTFIYNLKKATVSEVAIYCPLAPKLRGCDEGNNHGSRRACESKALHLRTNQPEGKKGRERVREKEEDGGHEEREGTRVRRKGRGRKRGNARLKCMLSVNMIAS